MWTLAHDGEQENKAIDDKPHDGQWSELRRTICQPSLAGEPPLMWWLRSDPEGFCTGLQRQNSIHPPATTSGQGDFATGGGSACQPVWTSPKNACVIRIRRWMRGAGYSLHGSEHHLGARVPQRSPPHDAM